MNLILAMATDGYLAHFYNKFCSSIKCCYALREPGCENYGMRQTATSSPGVTASVIVVSGHSPQALLCRHSPPEKCLGRCNLGSLICLTFAQKCAYLNPVTPRSCGRVNELQKCIGGLCSSPPHPPVTLTLISCDSGCFRVSPRYNCTLRLGRP